MHTEEDLIKTLRFHLKDLTTDGSTLRTIGRRLGRDFIFIRPPGIFRRGYNKFIRKKKTDLYSSVLKRILKLRGVAREMLGVSTERGEAKFILRVDDFPRWDIPSREYMRFHEILRGKNIPYLLGVTPSISLDPLNPQSRGYRSLSGEEMVMLKEIAADGVEFALHGFTHQTRTRKKPRSELIGLSEEELKENIQKNLNRLKEITTPYSLLPTPYFFIPPFNTIDPNSCQVLGRYFRGVCAGREIIPFLGFRITPSYLSGTLYIPSYEPAYGYADEILGYLNTLSYLEENIILPLTLHWSWELYNGFKSVGLLADKISKRTIKWSSLFEW